ncbi:MAG TPA: avidin/streptavidin family protein [Acidimicrobiales bacterium]|nr:avidin/streptavidin family protein [Acidimicrobiales bacterium]
MQVLHATSIVGTWRNQLGSTLNIEVDGEGRLRGSFQPAVGSTPSRRSYPLTGYFDPHPFGRATVVGFVVDWTDSHSVTVWSGLFEEDEGTITATWLMTSETESFGDWNSRMLGHDVFRRQPE